MAKIWLDTLVLNEAFEIRNLRELANDGHTLAIANTAVDVRLFQEHINWFEGELQYGRILIEIWNTPDEMTQKRFYWSSCRTMTEPADTMAEAVKDLPNKDKILELAKLVNLYGMPKGEWPQGKWAPPEPLSAEDAEILGIPVDTDNRSVILEAAKKVRRKDVFDRFNLGYCRGIANQHCCTGIIAYNGGFTEI